MTSWPPSALKCSAPTPVRCGDLATRGKAPISTMRRALLAAGFNAKAKLECSRLGILAPTVKAIGAGARSESVQTRECDAS
jgi:hypothetical protein